VDNPPVLTYLDLLPLGDQSILNWLDETLLNLFLLQPSKMLVFPKYAQLKATLWEYVFSPNFPRLKVHPKTAHPN